MFFFEINSYLGQLGNAPESQGRHLYSVRDDIVCGAGPEDLDQRLIPMHHRDGAC
jgi:hypothetical protein